MNELLSAALGAFKKPRGHRIILRRSGLGHRAGHYPLWSVSRWLERCQLRLCQARNIAERCESLTHADHLQRRVLSGNGWAIGPRDASIHVRPGYFPPCREHQPTRPGPSEEFELSQPVAISSRVHAIATSSRVPQTSHHKPVGRLGRTRGADRVPER